MNLPTPPPSPSRQTAMEHIDGLMVTLRERLSVVRAEIARLEGLRAEEGGLVRQIEALTLARASFEDKEPALKARSAGG